jgi:hypothetical protein
MGDTCALGGMELTRIRCGECARSRGDIGIVASYGDGKIGWRRAAMVRGVKGNGTIARFVG